MQEADFGAIGAKTVCSSIDEIASDHFRPILQLLPWQMLPLTCAR
jgi:hypothetical protein